MTGFWSTYGLLYPWALLALPAALAALIIAYRRRGRGPRVLVASTFLLQRLKRPAQARSRFIPPLRFFFELLLLTALIAGAAGLYHRQPGFRVAVVLDNSFSMKAPYQSGPAAPTRFAQAQLAAAEYLRDLSADTRVELLVLAPELKAPSGAWLTPAAARAQLADLNPVFAAAELAAALQRLVQRADLDRIVVFTDQTPVTPAGVAVDPRLRLQTLRDSADSHLNNLALIDIAALEQPTATQRALRVTVAAFSDTEAGFSVRLKGWDCDSQNRELEQRKLRWSAGQTADLTFTKLPHTCRAFEVALEPENVNLDALAEDNRAWISFETEARRLLLVGTLSPAELGLSRISGLSFEQRQPEDYRAQEAANYSAVIFHRVLPAAWPPVNTALIFPTNSGRILKVQEQQRDLLITRWSQADALLRYLNLAALELVIARPLEKPLWAEELIGSSAGTIFWAGERAQRRIVASGFELLPFRGKDSPLLSVLTLNMLKWLGEDSLLSASQPLYQPLNPPAGAQELRYLEGPGIGKAANGRWPTLVATTPGLLEWVGPAEQRRLSAANFFSPAESNLRQGREILLPARMPMRQWSQPPALLAAVMAALLLILLLLDLSLSRLVTGFRQRQKSLAAEDR